MAALANIAIALTAIKALQSLYRIITTSAPDFAQYYHAETSLLPPPSQLLYLPLRILPYQVAQTLWVTVSLISLFLVIRLMDKKHAVFITALAYLSFPVRFTLGMGQVNLIALFVLTVSLVKPSGVLFALAVLLKPELILLTIPLILARSWRMILEICVTIGIILAFSLIVFGVYPYALHLDWSGMGIYYNQGLSGLVARAGGAFWVYAFLSGIVLFVSVRNIRNLRVPEVVWRFAPTFLLIEPIAWQHHFVFLIPTYIVFWKKTNSFWMRTTLVISSILISWNASSATLGTFILWVYSLSL